MTHSIDRMYAWITTDDEGEGVAAYMDPNLGWLPLVGADMQRMDSLKPVAQALANAHGKKLILAKFEIREDVATVEPNDDKEISAVLVEPEDAVRITKEVRDGNEQKFNICTKCGRPVPQPFKTHVENLGGCPEGGTND